MLRKYAVAVGWAVPRTRPVEAWCALATGATDCSTEQVSSTAKPLTMLETGLKVQYVIDRAHSAR